MGAKTRQLCCTHAPALLFLAPLPAARLCVMQVIAEARARAAARREAPP
jgi:hypothetical protein